MQLYSALPGVSAFSFRAALVDDKVHDSLYVRCDVTICVSGSAVCRKECSEPSKLSSLSRRDVPSELEEDVHLWVGPIGVQGTCYVYKVRVSK